MGELFSTLIDEVGAGGRVALCVVVATRGSTPQERGAKMLVTRDGRTVGTLGGGCVEAEVRRLALELIANGESKLLNFSLDHDYGWDDGLICGGVMDILVHVVDGSEQAGRFGDNARAIAANRTARLELPIPGGQASYVEEIGPPPVLVIAGAGHVGQALAAVAAGMGFVVDVIDDRADMASRARFPAARTLIVASIHDALSNYPVDANTYVVIVTRGHRHDGVVLSAVLDKPARYVGLIGSKSKIKQIFDSLHQGGVSKEKLLAVHAPIGLDIGAVAVPEIAISIAAELVAVRHGRANQPASAMKFDEAQLLQWLNRPRT